MFPNKFTPRQQQFIKNYLIFKNATKAAKLAGYSDKTARSAGSRLLTNVDISEAVESGLRKQLNEAEISTNDIILALRTMALSDSSYCPGKLKALELFGRSLGLFQKQK